MSAHYNVENTEQLPGVSRVLMPLYHRPPPVSYTLQGCIGVILHCDANGRIDGDALCKAVSPEVHRLIPLLRFLDVRILVSKQN